MDKLINSVKILVENELIDANLKFGMFNSMHEGFAVIKEEIEEVEEELEMFNYSFKNMWCLIKVNNNSRAIDEAFKIKRRAVNLAAEAIQTAAMAQKFIDSEVIK